MINLRFSESLHRSGLQHRAQLLPDQRVVYRLSDGSGSVALSRSEWDAIGKAFEFEIAPYRKRSSRLMAGLFPAVFLFAVTIGQFLPIAGIVILLGIFGGPVAIYFWYANKVDRAAQAVEARLKKLPRVQAVKALTPKLPRAVEILSLIFVGPYLLISVVGEIGGPDTFRNTPLSGAGIGWIDALAFGLIGIRLAWPALSRKVRRS